MNTIKAKLTEAQITALLETLKRDSVNPDEVARLEKVINKSTNKNKRIAEYIEQGGELAKRILRFITLLGLSRK